MEKEWCCSTPYFKLLTNGSAMSASISLVQNVVPIVDFAKVSLRITCTPLMLYKLLDVVLGRGLYAVASKIRGGEHETGIVKTQNTICAVGFTLTT